MGLQDSGTIYWLKSSNKTFWWWPVLNIHWKDWCWTWNSNTLATSCEELTHWKRPWCWERLKAGGEGDNRGGDNWMASLTQWTWVWVNSRSWWWAERPGVLQSMGSQRVGHDWATELNWTELNWTESPSKPKLYLQIKRGSTSNPGWFVIHVSKQYIKPLSQQNAITQH